MPIYTYRCNDCGHRFETRQRMAEDPLTDCPVCNGRVRRIVNSVGVVFKGKGFYITDNRGGSRATLSSNGQSGSQAEKSTEKSAEKSSEKRTASDTKAAKPEAPKKKTESPAN